jgi:hypothetical protein
MKHLFILSILSFVALSSCNKTPSPQFSENAIIRYYGDPALDGCGWVLEFSDHNYKAINLPENFKIDSLEVHVEYNLLESWASCGLLADAYAEIDILNIQ